MYFIIKLLNCFITGCLFRYANRGRSRGVVGWSSHMLLSTHGDPFQITGIATRSIFSLQKQIKIYLPWLLAPPLLPSVCRGNFPPILFPSYVCHCCCPWLTLTLGPAGLCGARLSGDRGSNDSHSNSKLVPPPFPVPSPVFPDSLEKRAARGNSSLAGAEQRQLGQRAADRSPQPRPLSSGVMERLRGRMREEVMYHEHRWEKKGAENRGEEILTRL